MPTSLAYRPSSARLVQSRIHPEEERQCADQDDERHDQKSRHLIHLFASTSYSPRVGCAGDYFANKL